MSRERRYYYDIEHWERPVQCPDCGVAVQNTEAHDEWHDKVEREFRQALNVLAGGTP